jgi:hypothetical protein
MKPASAGFVVFNAIADSSTICTEPNIFIRFIIAA